MENNSKFKQDLEIYYNKNEVFHNEYDYACQTWRKNGEIINQLYYLNGIYLTEQEWKEKTGKEKTITINGIKLPLIDVMDALKDYVLTM